MWGEARPTGFGRAQHERRTFPVADVSHESPRLAWLKRHGVITFLSLPNDPEYRLWMAGLRRWTTEFTDCNATPENIELDVPKHLMRAWKSNSPLAMTDDTTPAT